MVEQLAPEDLVEDWNDLSTSDLAPGTRLGRYELLVPIAYGGMARVWGARQHGQRGFSKLVAIKTILPHLARDPEFERMFLDEARIASGVHHPNVCEIYELGEEGHCLYLVMEWIHGDSFVHVLRPGGKVTIPIDLRVAARVCADACAGLHAAHGLKDDFGKPLGVVHRDVSPHNVLISIDGHVKVTDFGVAKAYGQMHQATVAGQVKGKVAYMAPEQISGGVIDRRSDVYSVGCMLYEATTGRLAFQGENDPQVMHAVIAGEYAAPSRLVPGYPAQLEQIVRRAMSPDQNARFATAEAMRLALEDWLVRSGPVLSQSQVGDVVRARSGVEVEKRRDRLRRMFAQQSQDAGSDDERRSSTPSYRAYVVPPSGSGVKLTPSPLAQVAPRATEATVVDPVADSPPLPPARAAVITLTASTRRRRGRFWMAVAAGVGVVAAVGVAKVELRAGGSTTRAASMIASNLARAAPTIASVAALPVPTGATMSVDDRIKFNVTPNDAILVVDGKTLDPTDRSILRPPPGVVIAVIVRSTGYDDEPLKIDNTVPADIAIILERSGAPRGAYPLPPAGGGAGQAGSPRLPPNPY
jgi:eukaryotic-like serine/threonine-protein kinase